MLHSPHRRVFVLLLVCLGATVGCNDAIPTQDVPAMASSAEWVTFTSTDGKVTAKFPSKPSLKTETVPSPIGEITVKMNMVETRDAAFIISHLTYPIDPSEYDTQAGLKGAVEGAASNVGGTIVEETDIEQSGFPGKEILVRGEQDIYAKARMYIDPAGPTLFQGLAVGDKKFVDGSDAAFFLESMKVK